MRLLVEIWTLQAIFVKAQKGELERKLSLSQEKKYIFLTINIQLHPPHTHI